jgi:hypothetical protein
VVLVAGLHLKVLALLAGILISESVRVLKFYLPLAAEWGVRFPAERVELLQLTLQQFRLLP